MTLTQEAPLGGDPNVMDGKVDANQPSPTERRRKCGEGRSGMRRVDTAAILNAANSPDQESEGGGVPDQHLAFLQRISERLQRVGLTFPGVEVRWEDLEVEVTIPRQGAKAHTLVTALAAIGHAAIEPLKKSLSRSSDPRVTQDASTRVVLNAGSGRLAPGRMCLLLGPPGAGKTTLLKALAGQVLPPAADGSSRNEHRTTDGLRVRGRVTYNGLTPGSDFSVERSASFVSQNDLHFGEMTVEETLSFSAECLGPGLNQELHQLLLARETAAGLPHDPELDALWSAAYGPSSHTLMVELFARLLGIDHVMDTVVGNEMLKGISGGQKRRVTCGEMVVGLANVLMLDEITNGLDSNSALAIVRSLRNICLYAQATMLLSLLQPSPEVFACFDDVMLMSGGQVVFLGPREEVGPFFAALGLRPPPSKTEPDFLQEVISSPAYQRRFQVAGGLAAGSGAKWLAPERIREEFDRRPVGQQLVQQLAAPPQQHELQGMVLHKERYALPLLRMWWAVLRREALLFRRNKTFFIAGAVQIVFTAFLVSTTFIRLHKRSFSDANLHLSVIFFSLQTMFMLGFNFCPIYCQRLPVFYKQRDHHFYSAAAYAVSSFLMRLPELLLQASLWALMVYFSSGLVQEAGRFFIYWLNLVTCGLFSVTIFQLLGAITRHEVIAQGLGGVTLMLCTISSGFPIARSSIPGWWIWFYWANPMAWNLRSMAINELNSSGWADTSAELFGEPDKSMGIYSLQARGFHTEWKWVWAGLGAVTGWSLLLLGAQVVALASFGAPTGYRPPVEEDDEDPVAAPPAPLGAPATAAGSVIKVAAVGGPTPAGSVELSAAAAVAPVRGTDVTVRVQPPQLQPLQAPTRGSSANLSFTPIVMAFRGVKYFVPDPKGGSGELQLLDNVSGVFVPGVLTSLMGASGAGKTTLMDVLAGRKTGGRAEGQQEVNGQPKRMSTFARLMGYVEQFDAHNPQATVEEALLFSAHLRVPPGLLHGSAVRQHVADVMSLVELGPLAGAVVGYGGNTGLSTEARKRLTIACELVANPAIVFLDEPTTGLDARAAGMVMRAVRNTVATGRTVVCTIHQPNREILDYFDELLLLKPGGRVIFNGSLGGPGQPALIAYLEAIPGVPSYHPQLNPANYMLEVTSPAAEKRMGADFATIWEESELAGVATARLEQHMSSGKANGNNGAVADVEAPAAVATTVATDDITTNTRYARSSAVQLYLLVQRGLVSYWRNPAYNLLRFAVTILLGLALGSLYWGRGTKRTSLLGVLDIMGALYTCSMFLPMVNCLVVMPVVAAERAVFYRERASGMYGSVVFAAAQGLTEFPYLFLQSVVYVITVYCTIHFEFESAKALWFWLFIWLSIQCFTFLGMAGMNLTPNMPASVALTSLFILLWMLFCGFLIYAKDIKPWWIWAYYFNPGTYSIYGCITTQLGDLTSELIAVGNNQFMTVAQYVEETFDYHYDMRGWLVLIMFGFIALFRAASYFGLSRLNFQVR